MNKVNSLNDNNKEGKSFAFFIALVLIILLALSLIKVDTLVMRDKFDQNILATRKLKSDSYIGIIYKHSVEKTTTSEWYRVEDGKLILMEERYKSQGAGLPTETEYKFKQTKDTFILYDINLPFEEVVYRTGMVIANHRLSIDGKVEKFTDFSKKRQAVAFTVEKVPFIKFITRRCIYG
jgi:hypothetical protein